MSSIGISRNTATDVRDSIRMAGQNHYGQVQGCLNLITLIEVEETKPNIFDSLSQHLNVDQKIELNEIVKELSDHFGGNFQKTDKFDFQITAKGRDSEVFSTFQKIMYETARNVTVKDKGHLLQRSILIILVSGFETLMSDLAAVVIRENPGVANLDAAKLSLAELQGLGSIAEAEDHLTSTYVEDLARGSIEDWVKWFEKSGVKLNDIPADWVKFREIFARRNLFVHTDGRVSGQYRNTIKSAGARMENIPEKDSSIPLSNEYLQESCELLMATGALLVTSVWMKLESRDFVNPVLHSVTVIERALDDKNFQACIQIVEKMSNVLSKKANLVTDCRLKIAGWTARMLQGHEESVASEARDWDVQGIDLIYSHVRSVLMADDERALREIGTLAQANRIAAVHFLSSGLYQGLRERVGSRLFEVLDIQHLGAELAVDGSEPLIETAT